jgi:hypothetical protein
LKTNETCRFEIQLPWKLDESSMRYRLCHRRRGSRAGLPGLEGSWPQFEEGRNAGADSGRKRPHGHGKSVDFSPATFCGFRNDADTPSASNWPASTGRPGIPPPPPAIGSSSWASSCGPRRATLATAGTRPSRTEPSRRCASCPSSKPRPNTSLESSLSARSRPTSTCADFTTSPSIWAGSPGR